MTKPSNTSTPMSSTKRAVHELRALIFSGELPAGSDHLETELAERLNMSRTPVREAALMLESQGLLELRPRKGVRILSLSTSDMREIYDILTELESLAAACAAQAGLTPQELSPLLQAIDDMDSAVANDNREAWAIADDRFHQTLVALGGNARLEGLVAMMSDQVRRARSITLFMRPMPTQSNLDHRSVYEAIRNGDADTARAVHHAHLTRARDMLIDLLEKHRLKHL